jgi:hypothetical protein
MLAWFVPLVRVLALLAASNSNGLAGMPVTSFSSG